MNIDIKLFNEENFQNFSLDNYHDQTYSNNQKKNPIESIIPKKIIFKISKEKRTNFSSEEREEEKEDLKNIEKKLNKKEENKILFEVISDIEKKTVSRKYRGPFFTKKINEGYLKFEKKFNFLNRKTKSYISIGKQKNIQDKDKSKKNSDSTLNKNQANPLNKNLNKLSKTSKSCFDFLEKNIFEEDLEDIEDNGNIENNEVAQKQKAKNPRIEKIYSYMEKNFKKLPKSDINTKDLIYTYTISENLNKFKSIKTDFSQNLIQNKIKQDNDIDLNMNFLENKNLCNFDFFFNIYKEFDVYDYGEVKTFDCIFKDCGKSFPNSKNWKQHYEMHLKTNVSLMASNVELE